MTFIYNQDALERFARDRKISIPIAQSIFAFAGAEDHADEIWYLANGKAMRDIIANAWQYAEPNVDVLYWNEAPWYRPGKEPTVDAPAEPAEQPMQSPLTENVANGDIFAKLHELTEAASDMAYTSYQRGYDEGFNKGFADAKEHFLKSLTEAFAKAA